MKFPLPSLTAMNEGALFDAQAKLAMEILKSPNFVNDCRLDEIEPAAYSLELAGKFFDRGVEQGLIEPPPDTNRITPAERDHVERNAQAQVIAQLHGQRVAQEEQNRVVPVVGRVLNG